MSPTLRFAAAEDVDAILRLWREADAAPTHTDDAGSVGALIAHDPDALIVADDGDGRIVGSVIAGWDGWRGSIYRLVVAPEHRRQGLARRLLAAAEDRLARAGALRSHAIVDEADPQAAAFWAASGWAHQPQRLRFVSG